MSKKKTRVQVGNLCYTIVEEPDGEHVYNDRGEGARVGLCLYFEERIVIHSGLSIRRKRETLAHELTHVFLEQYAAMRDSYTEEDVCDIMGAYGFDIVDTVDRIYPLGGEE